ncbi:hypothetical protein ES703_72618 [subsurface metagenome]
MSKRAYRRDNKRLTRVDLELEKAGRELEAEAEKAWREWMFGTNADKTVARVRGSNNSPS